MYNLRTLRVGMLLAATAFRLCCGVHCVAQGVSVTTWHNDSWRTGQNNNETVLSPQTVNFKNNPNRALAQPFKTIGNRSAVAPPLSRFVRQGGDDLTLQTNPPSRKERGKGGATS